MSKKLTKKDVSKIKSHTGSVLSKDLCIEIIKNVGKNKRTAKTYNFKDIHPQYLKSTKCKAVISYINFCGYTKDIKCLADLPFIPKTKTTKKRKKTKGTLKLFFRIRIHIFFIVLNIEYKSTDKIPNQGNIFCTLHVNYKIDDENGYNNVKVKGVDIREQLQSCYQHLKHFLTFRNISKSFLTILAHFHAFCFRLSL